MRAKLRLKRMLAMALTGALALSLLPGAAFADVVEFDDIDACEDAPDAGFTDVLAGSTSSEWIDCIAYYGITIGTGDGTTYSPADSVTRRQMALFIARLATQATDGSLDIPTYDEDAFDDIADIGTAEARNAINFIAELGITVGTTGGESYNPNGFVTREQMASFIARAHEALGVFDELGDDFEVDDERFADIMDASTQHQDNINILAAAGVVEGVGDGTNFNPGANVNRRQMSAFIGRSIGVLESVGLWNGVPIVDPVDPPIVDNQTFTDNPELVSVSRVGDIVTFTFDQNIPGKSLDFINEFGVAGSLAAGDEVDYYTGLRLYAANGTAYYPQEAGIFGNEVRARFESATVAAAAVRAGVYEDTVQNAVGRSNPASDFALRATLVPPTPVDPYFPQLTFVGNLRTTQVTPAAILVDYTFTFETTADAVAAEANIAAALATPTVDTSDFAVVGAAGQVFRAIDYESLDQSGTNVTATVVMPEQIQDIPVSQLRRGFVEEDTFAGAGLEHILLSEAWGNITEVNGTTTDPDLRAVERGTGFTMRFVFDEAVSVPTGVLDNPDLYTVADENDNRMVASSIGRSLIAADGATVMVATFTDNLPVGVGVPDNVPDYLDTVVAASVDTNWAAGTNDTVVATSAARGTDQVGSQQVGWSLPAQVAVTPVQPEVPADPTPGVTALPDLVSVEKSQNEVTGNWAVTYTFDQTGFPDGVLPADIDFSLYDAEGVRFSTDSRNIPWAEGTNVAGQRVFTFGPDESTLTPVFSNEQIAAAVLGTVQDADADLIDSGPAGLFEPHITEGHDGIS